MKLSTKEKKSLKKKPKPEHPLAMPHDGIYSPAELDIAYKIRSEKQR